MARANKQQLFMLEDGTKFIWNDETYELISCSEEYEAKVKDKNNNEINFNACALVTPIK